MEKVAEILAETWRGLLLSRDELSGWLSSMDRYSGGGDRPFWLESYGGRAYSVERKGSPLPINVDHLTVGVLGGTQPDKLESLLLYSDDDGLLARFVVVFPNPVPLNRPNQDIDEDTPTRAFERLYSLKPAFDENQEARPLFVHLTPDAQIVLQEFRVQCREWEANHSGLFKSHIGKFPGLVVRIALTLAHMDWAISADEIFPTEISENHLGRACHYVGEHLRRHAERAYGTLSVPAEVKGARRVAEIILAESLNEIGTREIQRRKLSGLQKASEIGAAFFVLVDAGWLAQQSSNTGGRPRKIFEVNPKLWGAK